METPQRGARDIPDPHAGQPTLTAGRPLEQADAVLILLHGRGAAAESMLSLYAALELEWLLGLSGVLSVLLGILFLIEPAAGMLVWVWTIGAYALIVGIVLLALAFRLCSLGQPTASRRVTT